MTDLPQWLQEWFAENEPGYRGRGIQLVLWLKPVDALPDRPGRKRTADARVTAEAGDRWANYAVHEQGWASILAMGNESDPVWPSQDRGPLPTPPGSRPERPRRRPRWTPSRWAGRA